MGCAQPYTKKSSGKQGQLNKQQKQSTIKKHQSAIDMINQKQYTFQPQQINIKDKDHNNKHEDYLTNCRPVKLPLKGARHHKQLDILKLPKSSSSHKIHYINYPKLGLNLTEAV